MIGDDVSAALAQFRAEAESRMSETVTVFSESGSHTDPETGDVVPDRVVHYAGPGRVRFDSSVVSDRDAGSQFFVTQDIVLSLPVAESGVLANDVVEVLGSSADPALVGARFKVKGRSTRGQTTAHRFQVEEVS